MTEPFLQHFSSDLLATVSLQSISLNLVLAGLLNGFFAGVIIGAIVWPIMKEPDALGRALLLAIVFGLIVAAFEVGLRILPATGGTMSSILDTLNVEQGAGVGRIIVTSGTRVLLAMLIGMVVGVLSVVPGDAIKGGIIGLLLGGVVGAVALVLLMQLGYGGLNRTLFRLIVGLLTWGLLASVGR